MTWMQSSTVQYNAAQSAQEQVYCIVAFGSSALYCMATIHSYNVKQAFGFTDVLHVQIDNISRPGLTRVYLYVWFLFTQLLHSHGQYTCSYSSHTRPVKQ